MRCSRRERPWPLLLVLGLAACWQSTEQSEPLQVERTSPALDDASQPVLLNDSLTVYFSDEILPLSVTPDSVSVLDDAGHQVPGSLQVGSNWVAFRPEAPLDSDLMDGSFQPGGRYRLMIAGYPRHDSIRTRDGRWLEAATTFDVHVAEFGEQPAGLPSLLRPPATELPFVLRGLEEQRRQLPADVPRLQLHFTQPVLPGSVRAEDFDVRLLANPVARLTPRNARIVRSPIDVQPGCTVELDLGALPRRSDGSRRPLGDGDWISVMLRSNAALCDFAGRRALPAPPMHWLVVAGRSLPLCEWPGDDDADYGQREQLEPGFERQRAVIRPRVRVEAGSGALGAFRPRGDVTLRPGVPFDRGDGELVVSDGDSFPFLSIDVPSGVAVTVDASAGPVRLLACGGVRIRGELLVAARPVELPGGRYSEQPVRELTAAAPVALLAAGNVDLRGDVRSDVAIGSSQTVLLVATAARLQLQGSTPFQTMLVADRIDGPRGQSLAYAASWTYGLADGAAFGVHGTLPWRRLPEHLAGGSLQVIEPRGELAVAWQATPADPVRGERPDLAAGRIGRWQTARDGDLLSTEAGAFVRLSLRAKVHAGEPLPRVDQLRIVAN